MLLKTYEEEEKRSRDPITKSSPPLWTDSHNQLELAVCGADPIIQNALHRSVNGVS